VEYRGSAPRTLGYKAVRSQRSTRRGGRDHNALSRASPGRGRLQPIWWSAAETVFWKPPVRSGWGPTNPRAANAKSKDLRASPAARIRSAVVREIYVGGGAAGSTHAPHDWSCASRAVHRQNGVKQTRPPELLIQINRSGPRQPSGCGRQPEFAAVGQSRSIGRGRRADRPGVGVESDAFDARCIFSWQAREDRFACTAILGRPGSSAAGNAYLV